MPRKKRTDLWQKLPSLSVVIVPLVLGVIGLGWGLPSKRRNDIYFASPGGRTEAKRQANAALFRQGSGRGLKHDASDPQRRTSRSVFNTLRSYHPDEYFVLKGIRHMARDGSDLGTGQYNWPGFIFMAVAAGLMVAKFACGVQVVSDVDFYFVQPDQIASM